MYTARRTRSILPAAAATVAGVVAAQVLRAAHRSDLPSFPNQDPSGTFGPADAPPLRIVALGDSSITAPGVSDIDNVWVRRAVRSIADRHRVELVSLAVGGSKTRDVVEGQLGEAIRLQPDISIISVGANDVIRSPSTERYRADLKHIVAALEPVTKAMVILGMGDLGSIPRLPMMLRPMLSRRSARYDAIAARVADSSPIAVKVWTRGRISTAFWDDHSLFAPDLFHAGDSGHRLFADEAMPAFRAALRIAGY